MDYLLGGLAAAGASIFSNPLDVLKTRMQLQGELKAKGQHAVHYKNVIHAGYVVIKNEGIFGLQKGLAPALVMHSIRNSIRLGIYQEIHRAGYLTDNKGNTIFYRSAIVSALSGAAGAFFGSPLFLIKTQLQSQSAKKIAVGYQHKHNGAWVALKNIYSEHGIQGLWRGVNGTMLRALVGSSAQLSTFAVTKDILKQNDFVKSSPLLTSFIASIVGGIFQTIMITPFDLVSTRLYNQGLDAQGRGLLYSGITDCFIKTWKTEGFFGFYKGVTANYMRLGPHGALTLVFWDILKDLQKNYLQEATTEMKQ